MKKDCREWGRNCVKCQRAKVTRHVTTPVGTFTPPSGRFEYVHIDIVVMSVRSDLCEPFFSLVGSGSNGKPRGINSRTRVLHPLGLAFWHTRENHDRPRQAVGVRTVQPIKRPDKYDSI